MDFLKEVQLRVSPFSKHRNCVVEKILNMVMVLLWATFESTLPWGILGATRTAAVLFGSRFVARSSQTTAGMLVARRLAGAKNPSRQTVSYLGYTTLVYRQRDMQLGLRFTLAK